MPASNRLFVLYIRKRKNKIYPVASSVKKFSIEKKKAKSKFIKDQNSID